jgi:hypothetical protein
MLTVSAMVQVSGTRMENIVNTPKILDLTTVYEIIPIEVKRSSFTVNVIM